MAARGTSDVSLIIRARDEASKALGAITSALDDLQSSQKGVASGAESTATGLTRALGTLADLDRAYSSVAGAADKGAQAFQRQLSVLAENQARLEALRGQLTAATAAQERFASFVGPRTQQQTAQYAAISAEVSNLNGQIKSLTNTVARQEMGLTKSASDLQALGSAMQTAGAATTFAKAQNEGYIASLEQQAAAEERAAQAAQRNASVLRAIRSSQYQDSGKSAEQSASVFNASGLTAYEKQINAEAELQKSIQQTNSALAERAQIEAALQQHTGLGALSATEQGASYDALKKLNAELDAQEDAAQADAAAIERLRNELNPMAAIQARAATETQKLDTWFKQGKITAQEYAAAQKLVAANADRAAQALGRQSAGGGKPTLFGLKPYELTNLSYQINDVVTQLASGTSLTQTLAQQGGQLLQIFPRVGASIVAAFTSVPLIAFVAGVTSVILALKQAGDEADRLRGFLATLDASADGKNYGAKELLDASDALRVYGVSAEDAVAAVKQFANAGIDPSRFEQFGETAKDMADVLGIKVPDAAKKLTDAFSAGYDAIAKLDDAYNFLTAAQREHIRALFDEGNASEARSQALDIFTQKMSKAASDMRGPWTDAAHSLGNAWHDFLSLIADSGPINELGAGLNILGLRVSNLIDKLKGVRNAATILREIKADEAQLQDLQEHPGADVFGIGAARIEALKTEIASLKAELKTVQSGDVTGGAGKQVDELRGKIKQLQSDIDKYEADIKNGSPIAGTLQRLVDRSKEELAAAQKALADVQSKGAGDTIVGDSEQQKKATQDALKQLSIEEQLQKLREQGAKGLSEAETQRRVELAGQIAFNQEIEASGNRQIALAKQKLAVDKESVAAAKQNEQAAQNAAAAREREIAAFESRVIGTEGGAGKNPFSSAQGFGQFIDSTWLDQVRKVLGDEAKQYSEQQLLAMRQNATIAKGVIDNYAHENAKFLESFGAKVTAGNLYLAHFLGPDGAKKILTADPNTPVDQLLSQQVINENRNYLTTNGRARTAGELKTFINNRIGDTGTAQTSAQVELNNLVEKGAEQERKFHDAIAASNAEREHATAELQAQQGLIGNALLAKQREQAIDDAIFKKQQEIDEINKQRAKDGLPPIKLADEERAAIEKTTGAYFDLQHAKEQAENERNTVQRPVDDLTALRDQIQQQITFFEQTGQTALADQLQPQLDAVNAKLQTATASAIQYYQALAGDPTKLAALGLTKDALDAIIQKLQFAQQSSIQWGYVLGISAQQIAQTFASTATSAVDKFAQAIANGEKATTALKDAFLQFAADFLRSIAQMILQQLFFNAISGFMKSIGLASGGVPVPAAHGGGIIGDAMGMSRTVNPAWFATAARYHTGGIAGLAPNEVPAVLQRGEEVLTRDDPRHSLNGGAGGGEPTINMKNVVVYDPVEALERALADKRGEKVVLTWLSANSHAAKGALG